MSFALIIPTYNPGKAWLSSIRAIKSQILKPDDVLIIDSSSVDTVVADSLEAGFSVKVIEASSFDHGGTRKMAAGICSTYEYVVFMTQDAVLFDENTLQNIIRYFSDENVAAVCGRQLPRQDATPIEAHARLCNYSSSSFSRSIVDRKKYGLKTAFISNSFAAYRVSALNEVGSFPENVIFGEDMYVAAKLLSAGYRIAYAADACVYHSHDYTLLQEMKRYFDMGVFHARQPWIRKKLGGAEGEGVKFVTSEFKYLLKNTFWQIPEGLLRTILRYTGFRLGLVEKWLPLAIKRRLAMNNSFFKG